MSILNSPSEGRTERASSRSRSCCNCLSMNMNQYAKGVTFNGVARGAINMSNVYLGNSFILLACKAAGGADDTGSRCINRDVQIYGMKPAALISNIIIASTKNSAFCMPLFGAVIYFTPHRKWVGIGTAAALTIISGIQIGTVYETWFAMAILQAIIFMVYQVQLTALFAYYPEIARDCGEDSINSFATTWSFVQFSSQALVNLMILLVIVFLRLGTVHTAMVCQGVTMAVCAVFLTMCWKSLPSRPRRHKIPDGYSLAGAGFRQNCYMAMKIWRNYKVGLRWFLLSSIFAEAAASAVGSTAVIFLNLNLQLNALQIGIFFEVSLIGVVAGTKLGMLVTRYTTPTVSLMLSELGFGLATAIGAWAVQGVETKELTYLWGFSIGIFLGWFYPCESVFFSMCVPYDVEAELAGFFQYCSQVIGWLPPIFFTVMVQANIPLPWALTAVAAFFIVSIFFLCFCGRWEDIVHEAKTVEVDFHSFEKEGDDTGVPNGVDEKKLEGTEPEKIEQEQI